MAVSYPGKRLLDVVGATVALVVTMPLQIVIAVTIQIDTRGPVLFRQTRLGAGGRPFELLKFRTLAVESDDVLASSADEVEGAGPLFKMHGDPRVTRVGRFLRRSSFDELPQLVNVLRGDMSLVGPRPAHLTGAAYYEQVAPRRLRAKPGMTGLWQASGGWDLPWDEAVRLDLVYVDTASLRLDLAILARTSARSLWTFLRSMKSMFVRAPMVW
jgi:lipopolysaccharide/colanic/teichoic acid biosynthesis glycosyltransferase